MQNLSGIQGEKIYSVKNLILDRVYFIYSNSSLFQLLKDFDITEDRISFPGELQPDWNFVRS